MRGKNVSRRAWMNILASGNSHFRDHRSVYPLNGISMRHISRLSLGAVAYNCRISLSLSLSLSLSFSFSILFPVGDTICSRDQRSCKFLSAIISETLPIEIRIQVSPANYFQRIAKVPETSLIRRYKGIANSIFRSRR